MCMPRTNPTFNPNLLNTYITTTCVACDALICVRPPHFRLNWAACLRFVPLVIFLCDVNQVPDPALASRRRKKRCRSPTETGAVHGKNLSIDSGPASQTDGNHTSTNSRTPTLVPQCDFRQEKVVDVTLGCRAVINL